jgi:hypothetical protein
MKAKFGSIVVDGRGKIGGHVASKNRAGSYFRTKVTPVNPRSAAQLSARNRLTVPVQAWRGLTDAQRSAWNAAVPQFSKTDIFGDLKSPSGFNLYAKLSINLSLAAQSPISLPPTSLAVSTVTLSSVTAAFGTPAISMVLSGNVPAGTAMIVNATPALSAGKSFVKSELRRINTYPAATATPVNLLSVWTGKFGSIPAAGLRIFFEIYFINITTGVSSARQRTSVIIAA